MLVSERISISEQLFVTNIPKTTISSDSFFYVTLFTLLVFTKLKETRKRIINHMEK